MRIIVHSVHMSVNGTRRSACATSSYLFFFRDDLFHDFGRSRADRVEPNVAPGPADWIFGGVAETAEHLHAVVSDFLRELGSEQLGHGDFAHALLTAIHQIQRAIG